MADVTEEKKEKLEGRRSRETTELRVDATS